MEINIQNNDNFLKIGVKGRIDATNADEFQNQVQSIDNFGDQSIVFDFSDLNYISSAGLRVLMLVYVKLNQNSKRMAILSPTEIVAEVLTVSGLTDMMPFFSKDDDAIEYLIQ